MLFSEKFQIEKDIIEKYGAIDISLVCDIPLFIDPMLIFNSNKDIYIDLHKNIIRYFHFLAKKSEQKLELADIKNWFTFKEVCNNWFGYALEGNKGSALDIEFGKFLYNNIKFVLKTNDIPSGEHAEKVMLLYEGSGRDKISDMTVNLIKGFLCEYTQDFAQKYLKESDCSIFPVEKAEFNYETECFITKKYYLPFIINEKGEEEFILLTPSDILRKNEPSLNRDHFLKNNRRVRDYIENDVLKAQVNNYIAKAVAAYEKELINIFQRLKHEMPESSSAYEESKNRIKFFKHIIEDCDGYRNLYYKGERISTENDLQRMFKFVWYRTSFKPDFETNNGRGPADVVVSKGMKNQNVIEFKLASNPNLKHVFEQTETYKKANEAEKNVIAIFYFTEQELIKVNKMINEAEQNERIDEDIILIDCRNDNKPSALNFKSIFK